MTFKILISLACVFIGWLVFRKKKPPQPPPETDTERLRKKLTKLHRDYHVELIEEMLVVSDEASKAPTFDFDKFEHEFYYHNPFEHTCSILKPDFIVSFEIGIRDFIPFIVDYDLGNNPQKNVFWALPQLVRIWNAVAFLHSRKKTPAERLTDFARKSTSVPELIWCAMVARAIQEHFPRHELTELYNELARLAGRLPWRESIVNPWYVELVEIFTTRDKKELPDDLS